MAQYDRRFLIMCQTMIDAGQFRVERRFETGSRLEVEGNDLSLNEFSNSDAMDVDVMFYLRNRYVLNSSDLCSDYRGEIIRYATKGIHPGYVRLLREADGREVTWTSGSSNEDLKDFTRHGPAEVYYERESRSRRYNLTEEQVAASVKTRDNVIAHHSPYWPREPVEWITRQRPYGSHSRDVIRRVVGYGCDFVCASHKGYIDRDKDHEWRFSFSVAELILIKSWSRQQRAVYRTIRVLHKMSLDTGRESHLCTYYYKTLMLWAVETKSSSFWDDKRLYESVQKVFGDMIRCLMLKCLPHCFIPENNLFDHLFHENLSSDINVIVYICEDIDLILGVLDSCMDEELFCLNKRTFVTMPQHYYNSLSLLTRVYNTTDNFCNLFHCYKTHHIHNSLMNEFDTTKGLLYIASVELKTSYQRNEETFLLSYPAIKECLGNNMGLLNVLFSNNNNFCQTINNCCQYLGLTGYESWLQYCELTCVRKDASVMPKSSKTKQTNKYVLYSRNESWLSKIDVLMSFQSAECVEFKLADKCMRTDEQCLEALNLTICDVIPVGTRFRNTARYFNHWPDCSPTVPVSWFINKAYTANHYYTLLSDCVRTLYICDEIINAYKISLGNQMFAEVGLPVLLSTRWNKMYDKELHKILGLAALCRFVIHGSDNRPVHLPVCPVQFALYLKTRCVTDTQGFLNADYRHASDKFYEHGNSNCKDKTYFSYGSAALSGVLTLNILVFKASIKSSLT